VDGPTAPTEADVWAARPGPPAQAAWAAWAPEPPTPSRSPALPWVLAALLLVLGLLAAALGASGLLLQREMDRGAVPVRGTVVAVDPTYDVVEVTYPWGSGQRRAEVTWYGEHPRLGEQVDVEHHPDDPTYARVPGSDEDAVMGTAFLVVGGALGLAGGGCVAWAVRRRRRQRHAWPRAA